MNTQVSAAASCDVLLLCLLPLPMEPSAAHCRGIMAQALRSVRVHLIATENALPMITSFAQAPFYCHILTTHQSIQSNIYFHTFD